MMLKALLLTYYCSIYFAKTTSAFVKFSSLKSSSVLKLNFSNNKNISASERERWDEDKRRIERKGDVVIGKTSAQSGAKDLPLMTSANIQQLYDSSTSIEREVLEQTERGMSQLKEGDLVEANEAFQRVFDLKSEAYLWQAGIAKFYLSDIEEAGKIFSKSTRLFEKRFGECASEERIWTMACELKMEQSMKRRCRRRRRINMNDDEGDANNRKEMDTEDSSAIEASNEPIFELPKKSEKTPKERRKVLRIAEELFSAALAKDFTQIILCKSKLKSILVKPGPDRNRWKAPAAFYLGLYYDAFDQTCTDESIACMKNALKFCMTAAYNDDLMQSLPVLHMTARNWYDDEEILQTEEEFFSTFDKNSSSNVISAFIKQSIDNMRLDDLKKEVRKRGIPTTSSCVKKDLQELLFKSIIIDAATDPDFS